MFSYESYDIKLIEVLVKILISLQELMIGTKLVSQIEVVRLLIVNQGVPVKAYSKNPIQSHFDIDFLRLIDLEFRDNSFYYHITSDALVYF